MSTRIAETASVDPRAELGDDVEVGPFCDVGPDVRIGRGTRVLDGVSLLGTVTLGEFNTIGPFAAIGGEPQDVSYGGAPTRVEVGDRNVIRERVTIHRATEKEEGFTRIGSHNVLMANSHVAHDCHLGDRITLGTGSMLGGHVRVESFATLSEGVAVVQFVTIGGYSLVGTTSKVNQDAPRYLVVDGNPSEVRCVYVVGLKRNGFGAEVIHALHEAHRLIYRAKMGVQHATEVLESHGHLSQEVRHLLDFILAQQSGKGGRARERRGRR